MIDSPVQHDTYEIDGVSLPLSQPASATEVGKLVIQARETGEALYPLGGGTQIGFGLPPEKSGIAVDLKNLNRVVDYPARDMTVTVEAGITVSELQNLLAGENQRLPIDVAHAAGATLGGAVAANASGLRRYGFGALRDYVIGISVVNDRGEQVKAGGRVVKNVAGYDMAKLYIGSLGTLGIVSQVTLKVLPRPEQQALVTLSSSAEHLDGLLERLHQTATRPVAVELLNPAAVKKIANSHSLQLPDTDWLAVAGFESNADSAGWQVQQLIKEIHPQHPLEAKVGDTSSALWTALADFPGIADAGLTFKAALPAGRCAAFCRELSGFSAELLLQAHAGNGIVIGHLPNDVVRNRALEIVNFGRDWAEGAGGSLVVQSCPPAWKNAQFVWGRLPSAYTLMKKVKEKLDPHRIFNPGRFVGGI